MKHGLLTLVLAFIVFSAGAVCLGQVVNPAKVKINGVGLDSTYAQVVRAIGKPASEEAPKAEECIGGREKTVTYPGLTLYMMDGDSRNKKTFEVKSFEVTSARWVVSGIKVGDSEATVKRKFGHRKFRIEDGPGAGEKRWVWDMSDPHGPGGTNVIFKDGRVVTIASYLLVC
jgi:hypothetical protein